MLQTDHSQRDGLLRTLVYSCPEDGHTELLAAVLRAPGILRSFATALLGLPTCADGGATVDSQVGMDDAKGQPDLRIDWQDCRVLIECKLGARLTVNQPVEYAAHLQQWVSSPGSGVAMLAFLVPAKRRLALAREVWSRLKRPDCPEVDGLHGAVQIRFLTWEDVQDWLAGLQLADPVDQFLADSLRTMVPLWITMAAVPFGMKEARMLEQKDTVTAVAALFDLVNQVREKLKVPASKHSHTASPPAFGYEFRWGTGDADKVWFGHCFRGAQKLECSPLFIQIWRDFKEVQGILSGHGIPAYNADEEFRWFGTLIPVPLIQTSGVATTADEVVELITRIRHIALSSH